MKEHIISTRHLKRYKIIVYLICFVLLVLIGGSGIISILKEKYITGINLLLQGVFLSVLFTIRTKRLKSIAYDHENIYVQNNQQEIIVPFENIKRIKLTSLIGTHVIELIEDMGLGKELLFKSSLWYPFNFKRIDDQVYKLQRLIDKAKQNPTRLDGPARLGS